MTLTIEMPPETEARLREKARQSGQQMAAYVRDLLEREVSNGKQTKEPLKPSAADIEKRLQAWREFDEIIEKRGDPRAEAGLPPLSDEDISRETIYAERGLVDDDL